MSDVEDVAKKAKTAWESFKKVFVLLKERKFLAAFKESFSFLRLIYVNHLKGKYITIKGKKIPRTLLAVIALLMVYMTFPSCEHRLSGEQSISEAAYIKGESNSYDKNGLKIYGLRKCEEEGSVGVCGIIENSGNNNFKYVRVTLTFHAADGKTVYEGGIEATDVESHARSKLNIPCSVEFAYFKLTDVVTEGMTSAE